MLSLSLVVLNCATKLEFDFFFHHNQVQAHVPIGAHNPPRKRGEKNERGKKLTPTVAQVLLDDHQTFFDPNVVW